MSLNIETNNNALFISCELLKPYHFENYPGPKKEVSSDTQFQFKLRDDFRRIINDIKAELFGNKEILLNSEFQIRIKEIYSAFNFKKGVVDKDRLTFDLGITGVPLNILSVLDFAIPEGKFTHLNDSKLVISHMLEILQFICENNSYGQAVLIRNQCFYYIKNLFNKMEDEMIVLLSYIFKDSELILNFNEEFCDFILEKYYALWTRNQLKLINMKAEVIDKKSWDVNTLISLIS